MVVRTRGVGRDRLGKFPAVPTFFFWRANERLIALDSELNALLLGSRSADPHHGHKGMLCKIEFNDIQYS
jgi:hypothetical protein